jgi:CBS domain-containing protein
MKVSEVMTRDVQTIRPDDPVQQAASFMLSADAGSIPVTDGERLQCAESPRAMAPTRRFAS